MGRLAFWVVLIIAGTVLFVSVSAAAVLTKTVAGTGGTTSGLLIGGIPTFFGAFANGLHMGGATAPKGGGAGAGATWQGGITQFGVPQAPSAPVQEKPKPRAGQAPV
jgi:hypothetical protein